MTARPQAHPTGVPRADIGDDEPPLPRHPPSRRVVAWLVTGIFLALSVLAAGYSLYRGRPSPDNTRPLPVPVPEQGSIR